MLFTRDYDINLLSNTEINYGSFGAYYGNRLLMWHIINLKLLLFNFNENRKI
jgi:hypothetical protein